jgi:LacI family transcriptional regulator
MSQLPRQPILLLKIAPDSELLEGILGECDAMGWRVVNMLYADSYWMSLYKPVGAILSDRPYGPDVALMRKKRIPIVCTMESEEDLFRRDARVFTDRRAAGRIAGDAFAERGFNDWGFVTFNTGDPEDPLCAGLRERAKIHGANLHVCRLSDGGATDALAKRKHHLKLMMDWVRDLPKPMAVLAFNYRMAVRITAACETAGFAVPERIAIACHGNKDGLLKAAPVPLSAIDMNLVEQGKQAVRLMKRLVDGEKPPRDPVYTPVKGFVERRSTDILAVSDSRVAAALRYIWDHLAEPLSVDDVSREVATSRNTLERAFRRCLNRGVNAELRRKRTEHCKELLRGSTMTLHEIAKATGFSSTRHLHRSFKDAFGMTPKEYRTSGGRDRD